MKTSLPTNYHHSKYPTGKFFSEPLK